MREEMRHHGALAGLAATQHGVVSHRQLLELGYSRSAIARAVGAARLHRLGQGVFAVGHPAVSRHGLCIAAVLGSGHGALLSHASAAWLWGLLGTFPGHPEVTTPSRGHRKSLARMHHSTILETRDQTIEERIPVTAAPRTLLDLAATGSARRLRNAIERAERLGLLDLSAVDDLLARCGRHRGRKRLRQELGIYRAPVFSRSRAERLFLALVEDAGLPQPAINTWVAGYEIDAYWAAERFAVEVDGWGSHRTRKAFETDPVRQEDLKLAGIDSIRITARRIETQPRLVAQRLSEHLTRRRRHLLDRSDPAP
jgi:predicted transcriptional regulator of viral defense system